MCGFVGCFLKNPLKNKFDTKSYLKLFEYRGPDSQNTYENQDKTFFLGFNRLSIIDLSDKGNQPFENDETVTSSNCEIYNFKELKKELNNYGFKSNSDSEIVIHGYAKWKDDLFKKLKGMFSINIYEKSHKLTLARDRFGIKPIFYYYDKDKLIFSSEFFPLIKILKDLSISIEENLESLENYFFGPYNFSSKTSIKNIYKLEPGSLLKIDSKFNLRTSKYWNFRNHKNFQDISFSDACEKFDYLMNKSMDRHMVSDVPLAVLYSGGIDSSLIAKLAIQRNQDIISITANFDNQFSDKEKLEMYNFNRDLGIKNFIFDLSSKNILKNIDKDITIYDDLTSSDPGYLTNFQLSQEVKKLNIKSILVGDGADEMLSGYSWYGLDKIPFKLLPNYLRDLMYFYSVSRTFDVTNGYKVFKRFKDILVQTSNYNEKVTYNELFHQLPNNYLPKVDRSTMRNSIEARVPYLDNDLYDFIISLPSEHKLKGKFYNLNSFKQSNEKHILREVSKKYLPINVCKKKKFGFSFDLSSVINENLDLITDSVQTNNSKINDYFTKDSVKKIFDVKKSSRYRPTDIYNNLIIWKFFLYECWKKKIS
jgi:asparagine synthase (glutamine-hydrolysing)